MKLVRILVSIVIVSWLAWRTNWVGVGASFARLQFWPWLAALGLYLVAQLVSSLRWQLLARPLGFAKPLHHYLGCYFVGMFFNLMLPTSVGGDVVRALYLEDRPGRRLPALVSVLVDRASGLAVLMLLASTALACSPLTLPVWIVCLVWGSAATLAGAFGLMVFRCGRQTAAVPAALAAEAPASGQTERDCGHLQSMPQASLIASVLTLVRTSLLDRPGLLLATTGLSLIVQVTNIMLVWLVGLAIGAPVPAAYYWIVVPMVSLLTVVLPSLNGHGVREGAMILFLTEVGVPESTALCLSFLWFAVAACGGLGGGLVYVFGRFPRPLVSTNDEAIDYHSDQGRERQYSTAA